MIKVLHIVLGLQVGGLEKFVLNLTDSYSADVQSSILCLSDPQEQFEIKCHSEIIRWNKRDGLSPLWAFKIARLVRDSGFDLVHTHNPSPHFYGALAGLISGVPVVHTKHGRNYPTDVKKVFLNRIASKLSQRIVAVSSDAADVCRQIEKIPAKKVQTILNGVDTQRFASGGDSSLRAELQLPEDVPIVGIVARLSPEKNHQLLLEACCLLSVKNIKFHLVIIGDGSLREKLEQCEERCVLGDAVTFLGMRQDVADLVKEFNVFVLSSKTEGVSLTLLEAMSCCIPVVATDVGGNAEVVDDGVTGFIVPQNAQNMADKIEWLLKHENHRKEMGLAGRERVLKTFSLQQASDQYLRLYKDILVARYG